MNLIRILKNTAIKTKTFVNLTDRQIGLSGIIIAIAAFGYEYKVNQEAKHKQKLKEEIQKNKEVNQKSRKIDHVKSLQQLFQLTKKQAKQKNQSSQKRWKRRQKYVQWQQDKKSYLNQNFVKRIKTAQQKNRTCQNKQGLYRKKISMNFYQKSTIQGQISDLQALIECGNSLSDTSFAYEEALKDKNLQAKGLWSWVL